MLDEHSQQNQRQPSYGETVVKNAVKSLALKKLFLLLGSGGLLLFLAIGGVFLLGAMFMSSTDQQQEDKYGGWEVGGITSFGKNEIPADYIPIYKAAAEKYNVPWNLLAAHHRVETVFSTIPMKSPVGAIGHMQFMPLTWIGWSYPGGTALGNASIPESILTDPDMIAKYGGYGQDGNGDGKADPWNLEDAVYTAAYYLAENGASEGNIREAVFSYNHADWYVEEVMGFADAYVSGYRAIEAPGEIIDGIAWPAPGTMGITSVFGYRGDPINGTQSFHAGLDMAGNGAMGNPVASFQDGTVIFAGVRGGYGNCIIIDHGNGITSLYGHLSKIQTSAGTKVKSGDIIGNIGSTGRSTGPHLHFVIKLNGQSVDPLKYLKNFDYKML